ncbi:MAG: hypothetical protein OHK0046_41230 [Anaerolineae bacterium]
MKIVFLGDSLTWGGYGGSFFHELAHKLPDDDLVNMGTGGHTVLNLLHKLDKVLAQEPDGVFVMVGGNDAISHVQPGTRPYYEQVKHVPEGIVTPEMFQAAYRDLLSQLQLAHVQTWVGLPPIEHNPAVVAALRQYNALAMEAARTFNIPVLDLMTHFLPTTVPERPPLDMKSINLIGKRTQTGWNDYDTDRTAGGYTFTFDGLHFTPEAASKAADLIAAFITG